MKNKKKRNGNDDWHLIVNVADVWLSSSLSSLPPSLPFFSSFLKFHISHSICASDSRFSNPFHSLTKEERKRLFHFLSISRHRLVNFFTLSSAFCKSSFGDFTEWKEYILTLYSYHFILPELCPLSISFPKCIELKDMARLVNVFIPFWV